MPALCYMPSYFFKKLYRKNLSIPNQEMTQVKQMNDLAFPLVQSQQIYVQVDTQVIHTALNAFVKINSKLGRRNLHCKQLQCVAARQLVSVLLLKYVDDLIILALFLNHFQIIPEYFQNSSCYQNSQTYSCIIPTSLGQKVQGSISAIKLHGYIHNKKNYFLK